MMKINRKTIENDEAFLRQKSSPVDFIDKNYLGDIELLKRFCGETECFALAAVQIGIPKRLVYLKNTTLGISTAALDYDEAKILINPTVLERKGRTEFWEACVSCLNYTGLVVRPYEISVQYYDQNAVAKREIFTGFAATVLAHELDHLDGILHMDIAKQVLELSQSERKVFREKHPYKIISKTCNY